jgi:diaminopimelate decarboxylase
MDHFEYAGNVLHAEDVPISELAERYGTPLYCYSRATLERHYRVFSEAFSVCGLDATVCYSVKSNSNQAVIRLLGSLGAGADCVSEGEVRRALAAKIPPHKIVFAGVGKSDAEMAFALQNDIFQFNVESFSELYRLARVASGMGKKAPVAFRVNPDVNAHTHEKISTGRKKDKFGVAWETAERAYAEAAKLESIRVQGIAVHIGSQLTSLDPFKAAFTKVAELALRLRGQGHAIDHLDLGGGLGVPYAPGQCPPSPAEYAMTVRDAVGHLGCSLALEPGRLIVANAGVLITRVIACKETEGARFLIVDAAMNDLIRPSFYDAYHEIVPAVVDESRAYVETDVVGPVCESGDVFAKKRKMREAKEGELFVIRSAGAYGAVMGSNYNTRLFPAEVLVSSGRADLVRERQTYDDLIRRDRTPDWLQ